MDPNIRPTRPGQEPGLSQQKKEPAQPEKKWTGRIVAGVGDGIGAVGSTLGSIGRFLKNAGNYLHGMADPKWAEENERREYKKMLEEEWGTDEEFERKQLAGTVKDQAKVIDELKSKTVTQPGGPVYSDSSEREQQLMAVIRDLAKSMPVNVREPFRYSPEHIAVNFIQEALVPLLSADGGDWIKKTRIEKQEGKPASVFSSLTEAGKVPIKTLLSLGVIDQKTEATGTVYTASAKLSEEKPKTFLKSLLLKWLESNKNLIIDTEKAEGFLDLGEEGSKAHTLVNKYVFPKSLEEGKTAARELGLPDVDTLLGVATKLALAEGLQTADRKKAGIFDNPSAQVQINTQANNTSLKRQVDEVKTAANNGKAELTLYYTKQVEKVAELVKKQAFLQSILAGESVALSVPDSPPPPPPPPPPPFRSSSPLPIKED